MVTELVPPIEGQFYAKVDTFDEGNGDYNSNRAGVLSEKIEESNVITSLVNGSLADPKHKLVIDVDMPVIVIPSSTEGHFHLFIDCEPMSFEVYSELLYALAKAKVIETGYAEASVDQKRSAVRLPWVKK